MFFSNVNIFECWPYVYEWQTSQGHLDKVKVSVVPFLCISSMMQNFENYIKLLPVVWRKPLEKWACLTHDYCLDAKSNLFQILILFLVTGLR